MKKHAKLLSFVMVLSLTVQILAGGIQARAADGPAADASKQAYSDVQDHWAQKAIEKWSGLGILQGVDGKFHPDDAVTRGEMAVILDRLMRYQSASPNTFSDLGQAYCTEALLKANAAGVILGSGSLIRPADGLTREEAAVLLGRALGVNQNTAASGSFSDGTSVSPWALGYVSAMASKGYIHGSDGKFDPKGVLTRAALVTILDNAIAALYYEAKEFTGDVTGTAVVNTPGVTLKDMKITGDLVIAQGVGSGDVTLKNVIVTGNTVVRGGGANSIHIEGSSQISNIIIEKTDTGDIRVVTTDGAVVKAVFVDDGIDGVTLTGTFASVTVAADVSVTAVDADISNVSITAGHAALNVDAKSSVTAVTVTDTAQGAALTVKGTVETLTANTQITVNNGGTIKTADINANNVVIDGNKPTAVTVGSAVTSGPKDSSGNDVKTGTESGGGGGGGNPGGGSPGGGSSFTASTDSSTANDEATLGLVGTVVSSSATGIVTAAISGGKIAVTSVSSGTATVTVTDASSHQASIAVTVSATGAITIGTITKYAGLKLLAVATPTADGASGAATNIGKYSAGNLVGPAPSYSTAIYGSEELFNVTTPEYSTPGRFVGLLITTNKDISTLALKKGSSFMNLEDTDITEAVSIGATGRNTFVLWIDTQDSTGRSVSGSKTISLKDQGASDASAIDLVVFVNVYNPLTVSHIGVTNLTNPTASNLTVGDNLSIAATLSDGAPVSGRVSYYAELVDPNDSAVYYYVLFDSASNSVTIPASFQHNGTTVSTVGMYLRCLVRVAGDVLPTLTMQAVKGPIVQASTNYAYITVCSYNLRTVGGANYYDYSVLVNGDTTAKTLTALSPIWTPFVSSGLYSYTFDASGYVTNPVPQQRPADGHTWKVTEVTTGSVKFTDGTQTITLAVDPDTKYYQVNPHTYTATEAPMPASNAGCTTYITDYVLNGQPDNAVLYIYYIVQ